MTPIEQKRVNFAIKYYGVINNDADATIATEPTAAPYVDKATRQMVTDAGVPLEDGLSYGSLEYIATDECAMELSELFDSQFSVSIKPGSPAGVWGETFKNVVFTPAEAPWLQITGLTSPDPQGQNPQQTKTVYLCAGVTAKFFSHGCVSVFDVRNPDLGFPGVQVAYQDVVNQIQATLDNAENF